MLYKNIDIGWDGLILLVFLVVIIFMLPYAVDYIKEFRDKINE